MTGSNGAGVDDDCVFHTHEETGRAHGTFVDYTWHECKWHHQFGCFVQTKVARGFAGRAGAAGRTATPDTVVRCIVAVCAVLD
jgi:hypothetical protein